MEATFGSNIDYGMLIKLYGAPRETEARYSPAECIGTQVKEITRQARREAHQHILRRASEPHHADAHTGGSLA